MRSIFIFAISLLVLSACAVPQPQVTAVPTATATPPPTATVIPTPTISPAFLAVQEQLAGDTQNYAITGNGDIEGKLPDGTIGVIPGIHLNEDGTSYSIANPKTGEEFVIDTSYISIDDENGVHIKAGNTDAIITQEQLTNQMYLGQDNVVQIRDSENTYVLFAFDKETGTYLDASQYIQRDNSDPEKYIQVTSWDELRAIWAKEKLFMIPFDPDNTYFPPLDKIYLDYEIWNTASLDEYNYAKPFGHLPSGMDDPFNFVNYVRMARDKNFIGSMEIYFATEQVYNADDKSFSTIHPLFRKFDDRTVDLVQEVTMDGKFELPRLTFPSTAMGIPANRQLEEGGLEINGSDMPEVRRLTYQWLTTGHVPPELEQIPIMTIGMHY